MQLMRTSKPRKIPKPSHSFVLRDESRLGKKTAFLFLGLAVGSDLDRELGSVLCAILVSKDPLKSHAKERTQTHLVNIRLRPRSARNNVLDELGHLAHDIHAIGPGSQTAGQHGGLATSTALPLESDGFGLGPGVVRVRGGLVVRDGRHGACEQDFAVDGDATDRDDGAAVRGRSDVLHVDGRVGFGLEVGEGPAGGCERGRKRC
jgi:hypothetical protein